jgi:hypothetical protein
MMPGPTTSSPSDFDAQARALARRIDQQSRSQMRAERRLSQFDDQSDTTATGMMPVDISQEDHTMSDTLDDSVAASRRRIAANVAAFDHATLSAPVAAQSFIDTPEGLLDTLCRSAVASAAADLATLAGADPTGISRAVSRPLALQRTLLPPPPPDRDTA